MAADGRVLIETEIDTTGVINGTDEVIQAARRMAKQVDGLSASVRASFSRQADSIQKAARAYDEQKDKVEGLREKLRELKKTDVKSQEYAELEKELEKLGADFDRISEKQQNFLQDGGKESSARYKSMERQLDRIDKEQDKVIAKMKAMEEGGTAFISGANTEEAASLQSKLTHEEARLAEMNRSLKTSYNSLADKVNQYSNGLISKLKNLSEAAKKAALSLAQLAGRGIIGGLKKITTGIFGLDKATKKSNASFGMSLKTMIRYGVGVESLFALINKLRSAMQEGMKNLAQYSNSTNATLSGLMSSLEQCKNALATAFDPILQAVAPALNYLISLVTAAATAVAQLIAALTGKNTFIKAAKVQKDYAKSLSGTGSAAKKAGEDAEGSLASFDKLNVMAEENAGTSGGGGGGGGGISPDEMFETVPVESHFKDLADKIKEMWGGIFDTLKRAWDSKGQAVIDSAKAAFASLVDAAKAIGMTFYEVFTSDIGVAWVESILELLRSVLDVIRSIASAFTIAWNSGAGLENATALFNMYTNINMLLASIGDSFSRVFSNGTGVAIWTNILGIITGVWSVVGNLAGAINEAWNTSGIGDSIWQGILNIINTVLGTIHNITDATAEWARRLDFTPLLASIDGLLKSLEPLTENIGSGLEWFWSNVLLPIANWTIEEAIPKFLDMLSGAIGALNEVIEIFKPFGQWLWDNFLQPLAEWTGGIIVSVMEKIADVLARIGDWISEHSEVIQKLITIVAPIAGIVLAIANAGTILSAAVTALGIALGLLTSPVTLIIAALSALAAGFVYLYENSEGFREFIDGVIEGAKELVPGIKKGIEDAWDGFTKWLGEKWESIKEGFKSFFGIHSPSTVMKEQGGFLMEGLKEGISNFIPSIIDKFSEIKEKISGKWEEVKENASDIWNNIKENLSEKWDGLKENAGTAFDKIKSAVSDAWSNTQSNTSDTWESIKGGLSEIWSNTKESALQSFGEMKDGIINAWNEISNNTGTIWDGITGVIRGCINGIISLAEGMANSVIEAINGMINNLNKIKIDIPKTPFSEAFSLGFNIPTLSEVHLPRLASGTVVPPRAGEFAAILGDNKRETEVVSPLSTMKQALKEALSDVGGMGGGDIILTLNLDGRVVYQDVVKRNRMEKSRTGTNPLLV